MGRKAQKIELSDRLHSLMEREILKHQLERHFYERILIILKSAEGHANKDIANELGCDCRKVSSWRNRWYERMVKFDIVVDENGEAVSDKVVIDKIKALLSDNPRSGCHPRITENELIRLQALACESPEDYGLPFTVWTHQELSKQAKKLGIEISPSRYGVLLKKQFTSA